MELGASGQFTSPTFDLFNQKASANQIHNGDGGHTGALHLVNGFPRRIERVAIPDWERTGTAMGKGNFFSNGNSDIVLQNNDGSVAL